MINICILGNGTVGSGVVELLNRNKEYIKNRTGEDVKLEKVLVRDVKKHLSEKYFSLITSDIQEVINSNPDIIVEAMGGLYPAYDYIKYFLQKKKHVVTANKDVIANFGEELSRIAEHNGVNLRFEASVGGGIPILKSLQECLAGNNIQYFFAILNGTTNFILSKMYKESMKYENALKIAQQLGFAEANPESDVLGYDSARKLAILSTISYEKRVDWENINIEGITGIDETDIICAKRSGYNIKLLAISSREDENIYASVRPTLVPIEGQLGSVDNEFNGIFLEGDAVGQLFWYGKGAGKLPTASSILGDIFDIIEKRKQKSLFRERKSAEVIAKWPRNSKWFLRIDCLNNKKITEHLNKNLNNIELLDIQTDSDNLVTAVIEAKNESLLDTALEKVSWINDVKSVKKFMILNA